MSGWLTKFVILFLMALIVGIPVLYRPPSTEIPENAQRLIILTPHNEQIRYETEVAFSRWHEERFGTPVVIDWRTVGGTKDIERQLFSTYESLASSGREDEGAGFDMVFGGGDFFFNILRRGITVTDEQGNERSISIVVPIELPEELVASAFPSQLIADKPLHDPEGHWWGVVLSSFGIVYNRDILEVNQIEMPEQWSDLADGRYLHQLALADPGKSGSVNVTYEAILQRYGWEKGMWTLRRMFANARYFTSSASKVPTDVSAGEAMAGVCIDFYGRYQAEAVGGGNRIGFVPPDGSTVVTADPIGVLRGAPNHELAVRFVEFLLSRQGQAIWNFPVGSEIDGLTGPKRFALRRTPIRRDMYELYLDEMVDPVDPFLIARKLEEGTPGYYNILPVILHAMAMDIHSDIKAAWNAILRETDEAKRAEMIELFDTLPFTQDQIVGYMEGWRAERQRELEPGTTPSKDELRLQWTRAFRDNYRQIVKMAD